MRMKMGRTPYVALLSVFLVSAVLFGLGVSPGRAGEATDVIVIRGSNSLLPVVGKMVSLYSSATPGADIDLELENTNKGINDLMVGRADIAVASRPMSPEERAAFAEKGMVVREIVVARLGISVVTHSSNPVTSASMTQLAAVFSGEISNWKMLGGPDQTIAVVRKESGWSPSYFQKRVMAGKPYLSGGVIVKSKAAILKEVSKRHWAIGIVGMPEAIPALDRINVVRITSDATEDESTYALSRPMFLYSIGQTSGTAESFIEYVSTNEAQQSINTTGYFPAQQLDPLEDPD